MPKVSVIIPVFNVEEYIGECLESVINQTYRNTEIICIDDVSTDNSLNILKEYALSDSRIMIFQNEINSGLSYTRNVGLGMASGDYVLFVDSDDYINDNLIQAVVEKADNVDIVCFDYEKKDALWGSKDEHLFQTDEGIYNAQDFFISAVNSNCILYSACCKLYKRDFLEKEQLRFVNGIKYEDVIFDFLCMLKAQTIYCMPYKLYVYRIRSDSIMTKNKDDKNIMDYFYVICYLVRYYLQHQFNVDLEKAIEKYIQTVYHSFISNYRKYALVNDGYQLKNKMQDKAVAKIYGIVSGYEHYNGIVQTRIAARLEQIINAKYVILYGAGDIAREVLEVLNRYDIAVDGIAVTKKSNSRCSFFGNKVNEITDYVDKKDDSLVIMATTSKFYPEIERTLSELGFFRWIEVF